MGRIVNLTLLAIVAGRCLLAASVDCPHWISVMPLRGDTAVADAADAVWLGEKTVVDGVAFSCAVNPEGDPVTDRAAAYAERFSEIEPIIRKSSSVKVGVLMQATMGHGGAPGSRTPWQLAVHADGKVSYRFCPLDGRFLDYIARACRSFSAVKPDFFMVDDDTRLVWGHPGCFCPLHLSEFAKRTGRTWSREEVVAKLKSKDAEICEKWQALTEESLAAFFRTVRANYDSAIPGMLCTVAEPAHLAHVREFAQILAAPGQVPVVRGGGAPYHGNGLEDIVQMRAFYAAQRALVGTDLVYLQEADTCPHTRWATSATRLVNHMVMLALEDVKGAKIWITRSEPAESLSRAAYRRAFCENRGLMEWAAKADFVQDGFVIPAMTVVRSESKAVDWGSCYFSRIGIPYRIGTPRPGGAVALSGKAVEVLTDEEISKILTGRVLLDGTAALRLTERGFAADIGVAAKAWTGKTIQCQEFADGRKLHRGLLAGSADLSAFADEVEIRSKLFNRPRLGADFQYVAPGSIRFTNARGGTVFIFAHALTEQRPAYNQSTMYSETFRDEVVEAGRELVGSLVGGVVYLGDEPMMVETGRTTADGSVFVLDNLELDTDNAPVLLFASTPQFIERLQPDGSWRPVRFSCGKGGVCTLKTCVRTQEPAIFRYGPIR